MADAPDPGKPASPEATIVDEGEDNSGSVTIRNPHAPLAQRPLDHPSSPKAVVVPVPNRRIPTGARPGVEITRNESLPEMPKAVAPEPRAATAPTILVGAGGTPAAPASTASGVATILATPGGAVPRTPVARAVTAESAAFMPTGRTSPTLANATLTEAASFTPPAGAGGPDQTFTESVSVTPQDGPGATFTESAVMPVQTAPSPLATLVEPSSLSMAPLETLPPIDPSPSAPRQTFEPSMTDGTPTPEAARTFSDDSGPTPKAGLPPRSPPGPADTHRHKSAHATLPTASIFTDEQFRRGVIGLVIGAAAILILTLVWVFTLPETPAAADSPTKPIAHEKTAAKKKETALVPPTKPTIDPTTGPVGALHPLSGTIRIVTEPDSNVFVDGKDLGPQPVSVTLPAGKNSVVLKNEKLLFKRTVTIDVAPDQQDAVRFAFSQGWLEIDAPRSSRVSVDGRAVTGTHVQLWEGAHKVDITHANKKKTRSSQTVEITAGMTTSVHFEAPSIADE